MSVETLLNALDLASRYLLLAGLYVAFVAAPVLWLRRRHRSESAPLATHTKSHVPR